MLDSAEELYKWFTQKVDTHGTSPFHAHHGVQCTIGRDGTEVAVAYKNSTVRVLKRGLLSWLLHTKGKFSEYQLTRKETLPTFRLDALVFFRRLTSLSP